jgi:hypothetical protein
MITFILTLIKFKKQDIDYSYLYDNIYDYDYDYDLYEQAFWLKDFELYEPKL